MPTTCQYCSWLWRYNSDTEKNKGRSNKGRGIEEQAGTWEVVASQVTKEALTDKATFKQRSEQDEG